MRNDELKMDSVKLAQSKYYHEKIKRDSVRSEENIVARDDNKIIKFTESPKTKGKIVQFEKEKPPKKNMKRKAIIGVMAAAALTALVGLGTQTVKGVSEDADKNVTTEMPMEPVVQKNSVKLPIGIDSLQFPENNFLDKLIEKYNSSVEPSEMLSKNDIGIILQDKLNDGQIYKVKDGNGNETYFQDYSKGREVLPENYKWISADDIDKVFVVTNSKEQTAITGLLELENGDLEPLQVDAMLLENGTDAIQASEHYVHLKQNQEKLKEIEMQLEKFLEDRQKALEQDDDEPSL